MTRPKIWVFDNRRNTVSGDCPAVSATLARAIARRGWPVEILETGDRDGRYRVDAAGTPTFGDIRSSRVDHDDRALDIYGAMSTHVARSLRAAARLPGDNDLLLLVTTEPSDIAGAANWLAGLAARPCVALLFRQGDRTSLAPGTVRAALLRTALRTLIDATGRRPWVAATHEDLAQAVEDLTGWSCALMPSVTVLADHRPGAACDRMGTRLTILCNANDRQSRFAIPELMDRLSRFPRLAPISLRGFDPATSFLVRRMQDDGVLTAPSCDPFDAWESTTETDVAVLIFPRSTYRATTSARFTRLAGAGVPMVVPSGTWMADRIRCGDAIGLAYEHDATNAVLEAVSTMLPDIAAWRAAAATAAPAWRERYSADRLIDALLGQLAG